MVGLYETIEMHRRFPSDDLISETRAGNPDSEAEIELVTRLNAKSVVRDDNTNQ
jgi:hypothetical protein